MRRPKTPISSLSLLFILTLLACQAVPTLSSPNDPPVLATSTQLPEEAADVSQALTATATSLPPSYVYQPNADLPAALEQLVEQQNLAPAHGEPNEIS